ncbi:Uncharacterised protein [Slackia heliotrinireducens]|uniref:Calcineurin-like phosphoesterase domain-containing protein n=1 Tax=Slackia heliotrinireducens (strain ATCC 29202 / DSM 20476 / NCTC 11029 / RHS 1) TaxID=471855 RepID=C7N3X1_SLAHD|nr:metallophosphoesterase [Slackia heliotrinireducens]ACV21712.1 hypothetical protein Shel_06530 [Slackia heliotrinireducens DSM 20476]VEG99351.1 Uncharacterised protein [Slackia heliotrinireducens]
MAGRIFITGDTHATVDMRKLNSKLFPLGKTLDADDYVIICGDFGVVWANDNTDKYLLNWYQAKPWTTLFVDGNHENFDLLDAIAPRNWHGGMVHELRPKVLHLMRGQMFDIHGRSFFCMGGATSIDKAFRTEGKSWWPQEVPSLDQRDTALASLERAGWRADYVLTHCAPSGVQYRLNPYFSFDVVTDFLQGIEERLDYRHWFFGHYHEDRTVGERWTCVYYDILEIELGDDASADRIAPAGRR